MVSLEDNRKLIDLMKINFSYPNPQDDDFQSKIYLKREYYFNKVPKRDAIVDYQDIKTYRDKECGGEKMQLKTQQSLISNFINPDTPYKGLLVFHGVGTGKTCAAFAIAENFKDMVRKYNTKIYILLTGPLIREQWKNELVNVCAKDTYLKDYNQNIDYLDEVDKERAIKQAKVQAMQYYKIMSFRSFQKKVLGQKIIEKKTDKTKKKSYRKTAEGEIERDIAIDKIDALNNTVLIIDEAHNLTGNEYGDSVKKIINNSKNLRIVLLTATPMKNLADDIIELINLLRPENDQIERERVFSGNGHLMEFKEGGKEYLQKMVNGYVSYFRGSNPLTFAEANEIGEVPIGLNFTKVSRCFMEKFQLQTYETVLDMTDDTLDRRSQSVANFVYPGLSADKNDIQGYSGEEGINIVRNQLKSNKKLLLDKINEYFFNGKYENPNELLIDNEKKKSISGSIFKLPYLKMFSIKFFTCFNNISELVVGKKGSGTVFVYSNLVRVGIDLFKEVLLQNGFLEFSETGNYNILENTIDSLTGIPYKDYIKMEKKKQSEFHPATFITFTGKQDDKEEEMPELKIKVLQNNFNNINNKDGKYIKIVLGSRVMNEGITLKNVKEVHILDVYYNFGRVHQVIGRAVRWCSHYKVTNDQNPFPRVDIYKYVVSLSNRLSAEEELYQKAEFKYVLVKEVERVVKEASIDCPLNYHANIFPEEVEKYKDCITPHEYGKLSLDAKKTKILCPANCDFQKCEFKCFDNKLNRTFFSKEQNNYRNIEKKELDYTTFTSILKRNEVNYVKEKIKDIYKYKYVYVLDEINKLIRDTYIGEKADLFEEYFVYKALDELIPLDENDFNNFQDTIYDKYNKPGYLIYVSKYYIFQPFDQNENVPMWYRSNYISELYNDLTLYNYLKNSSIFKKANKITDEETKVDGVFEKDTKRKIPYDFSNIDYYNSKNEFPFVGIIDKNQSGDVFKIRTARDKILEKKRGTGIPSLKGAVCNTSKDKQFLLDIAKNVGVNDIENYKKDTRLSICDLIKNRLLYLEKFSTKKDKNNLVYIIIPKNHPIYPFPFNLEDRIKYIIDELQSKISVSLTHKFENIKNGIFNDKRDKNLARYKVYIENKLEDLKEYSDLLKKNNFIIEKNNWITIVE